MDVEARKKRQRGWALVTGLFLLAGAIAVVRFSPTDPQTTYEELLAKVDAEAEPGLMHREGQGFVAFLPNHGYHLSLYVGGSSRFAPGEFMLVNRVDGDLSIDLITGNGESNVKVLRGAEREAFLAQAELDLQPLDDLFERRFTTAGRQGRGR